LDYSIVSNIIDSSIELIKKVINMNFDKIKRLPYMSKRMYVIESICQNRTVDLEYLFGLLNLYNQKHSGKWFWQKATITGALKDAYDGFNKIVDDIVKKLKSSDEVSFKTVIQDAAEPLDKLLTGMELNCDVNRDSDGDYIRSLLDSNLRSLINDSLKPIRRKEEN